MSKIYDALENASKERRVTESPSESIPQPQNVSDVCRQNMEPDLEQEMISLYQVITAALPDITHRIILFVGSRSDEGVSTIVRQLAKTYALRMDKSVLVVDLDRSRPEAKILNALKPEADIEDVIKDGTPIEKALCRMEEGDLFMMPLFQRSIMSPRILDAAKSGALWETLRQRFDLILVDAPPATLFPDGPAIVSQMDGVILVVEAEKTRWQVANNVKDKIIQHGGNIIGTILNKRRLYIPDFIYKHL